MSAFGFVGFILFIFLFLCFLLTNMVLAEVNLLELHRRWILLLLLLVAPPWYFHIVQLWRKGAVRFCLGSFWYSGLKQKVMVIIICYYTIVFWWILVLFHRSFWHVLFWGCSFRKFVQKPRPKVDEKKSAEGGEAKAEGEDKDPKDPKDAKDVLGHNW